MASSMTFTASFFGGAVASTTRCGRLVVRASMDVEKSVAESSNTRLGLMMAAVGTAAVSSVANVAKAADDTNNTTIGGWRPVVADTSEIFLIAVFAVSEHNKQKNASLVLESVLRAEVQVVNGVNCRLVVVARDSNTGLSNNYEAIVYGKNVPTTIQLTSFVALLR